MAHWILDQFIKEGEIEKIKVEFIGDLISISEDDKFNRLDKLVKFVLCEGEYSETKLMFTKILIKKLREMDINHTN